MLEQGRCVVVRFVARVTRFTWKILCWVLTATILRSYLALELVICTAMLTLKVLVATIDALGHFETG